MKPSKLDLDSLEQKYYDLVWFARKHPFEHHSWYSTPTKIREGAFKAMMRVMEEYPEDVEDLQGESGDWHHGFNSGMLAALRLVSSAKHYGAEMALEFFPELDT